MKEKFLLVMALLSGYGIFSGEGERTPLLPTQKITHPEQPPLTFHWILENIPGRKSTVFPVTAAITGCFLAPAGYMSCDPNDCSPASAAMACIGSALWFYTGSCVVAAYVLPTPGAKPKRK